MSSFRRVANTHCKSFYILPAYECSKYIVYRFMNAGINLSWILINIRDIFISIKCLWILIIQLCIVHQTTSSDVDGFFFNLNKFLISLIMERSFYGTPGIFYDVTDVSVVIENASKFNTRILRMSANELEWGACYRCCKLNSDGKSAVCMQEPIPFLVHWMF